MKNPTRKVIKIFWNPQKSGPRQLSYLEYQHDLQLDQEKSKTAFEKAWATRNFEIEMYWKRATYFWTFIASALVGYFALINAPKYAITDKYDHAEVFFVICIGLCLALHGFLSILEANPGKDTGKCILIFLRTISPDHSTKPFMQNQPIQSLKSTK